MAHRFGFGSVPSATVLPCLGSGNGSAGRPEGIDEEEEREGGEEKEAAEDPMSEQPTHSAH